MSHRIHNWTQIKVSICICALLHIGKQNMDGLGCPFPAGRGGAGGELQGRGKPWPRRTYEGLRLGRPQLVEAQPRA
jgi:hypothetical protein